MNPIREGKEYCNAITLRSGREVALPGTLPMLVKDLKQSDRSEIEVDTEQKDVDQPRLSSSNGKYLKVVKGDKPVARDPTPLIPYSQRLKKGKLEKQFTISQYLQEIAYQYTLYECT